MCGHLISHFLGKFEETFRFMTRIRDVNHPSLWYPFATTVCGLIFRTFWRFKVEGMENIPVDGPAIIASNHRSYADPPLIGSGISRIVHFLAKKELFQFRPFGWLITRLNAHPINRAAGIGALKAAEEILGQGGVVIVFPEGRRGKTDDLQLFKPGVGMLAIRSGAPIVPAYIRNSGHMPQFKKVSVTYGPPLDPKAYSDYEKLAQDVMRRIQKMQESFQ
jgi:1-acyl-sn-glycerol-3-phosphate acyltransferase